MAINDPMLEFMPGENYKTDTDFVTPDWVLRTSTNEPDSIVPVLDFSPTVNKFASFWGRLPKSYAGGGLTIEFDIMTESTGAENVIIEASLTAFVLGVDNVLTKVAAAARSVTKTMDADARTINRASITFANGTQMNSLAAGGRFLLRVNRDAVDAADTMNSNDMELLGVYGFETA